MSGQNKRSELGKIAIVNPKILLRLEGAAVLIVCLVGYRWNHGGWIEFVLLFLVPDLSMIGYAANARVGAATYNALHTYIGPFALAGYSIRTGHSSALLISLIWIAHIGLDRMLGFGLKYPTRFQDTHLNPDRHALEIKNPIRNSHQVVRERRADSPKLLERLRKRETGWSFWKGTDEIK